MIEIDYYADASSHADLDLFVTLEDFETAKLPIFAVSPPTKLPLVKLGCSPTYWRPTRNARACEGSADI